MNDQQLIESQWEERARLGPATAPQELHDAVARTLAELDAGRLRVAQKLASGWVVHEWLKKAVLLSFRLRDNAVMGTDAQSGLRYYDKVEPKFADYDEARFRASGIRVVPPAAARHGAFIGRNVVLMPSFVNIGARTAAGRTHDHRGQLLHRGALRGRGGGDRRAGRRAVDGRVHRRQHPDL